MTILETQGLAAKHAERVLAVAGTAKKNAALEAIAEALYQNQGYILAENEKDLAAAMAAAAALHVPMVFVKKHRTGNLSGEFYTAVVHSYTHGTDYHVVVSRDYLCPQDRVLLVDDFLANGRALEGLMEIAAQAGAEVVGAACAIEKGFQHGGDRLRAQGVRVESLAIVESMDENGLTFR